MKNLHTFEEFLNESLNERTKFDVQKLLSKVDDELYNIIKWKDDASCYVSAPADAKDIIDAVKSKYPKSSWDPKTNLLVFESEEFLNEAREDWRELEGNDMDSMLDAISFLSRGIGLKALEKELKTKMPFQLIGSPMAHPKGRGMYSASINFVPKSSTKVTTEEVIDAANKVLNDHGYDKYKIQILK